MPAEINKVERTGDEVKPSPGTWQAEDYLRGRRFFEESGARLGSTATQREVMLGAPAAGHEANLAPQTESSLPPNIVLGEN